MPREDDFKEMRSMIKGFLLKLQACSMCFAVK